MKQPLSVGNGWANNIPLPGRSGIESAARSAVAYGAMVPSMIGGVSIGLLNRDRNQIVEYGIALWVQRLFAITGVTLNVVGEENLWSHRPAVFVYNHRNNFDPYVAIKLVHRDWGAVGKKELVGPLSGVMQWVTPNVAYVDRANHDRAVQSMRTVTEVISRGVSILVAPEGTRSESGELGVFKKGAFRMAMDAEVPIVPIVIRNADTVTGRSGGIIRKGEIDVAVLPPIAVTGWQKKNLESHAAQVRERFVETLANWPS
jgi:putative phosphoserine phosphatase / 1-acylglycerol-3-phosphate O-acyltransferase